MPSHCGQNISVYNTGEPFACTLLFQDHRGDNTMLWLCFDHVCLWPYGLLGRSGRATHTCKCKRKLQETAYLALCLQPLIKSGFFFFLPHLIGYWTFYVETWMSQLCSTFRSSPQERYQSQVPFPGVKRLSSHWSIGSVVLSAFHEQCFMNPELNELCVCLTDVLWTPSFWRSFQRWRSLRV